jgi:hypothetical protein
VNASREPLHQPPNPEDLRRAPPAGPDCARVRGWLRDYVDGDLEAHHVRELDEHVHRCRACGVELARAEHELLRVRQAFRELRIDQPVLPADFAQRVVERLVVDETSLVSAETLGAAAARAAIAPAATPAPVAAPVRERRGFRPGVALIAALAVLLGVGVGLELLRGPDRGPDRSAKLFLLKADGAYHEHLPLADKALLRERQTLRVRAGGRAQVEWSDRSTRPQPAATLELRGNGELRLENGAPLLLRGTLDVESHRDVSIPLSDGSRIDLGMGSYTIEVGGGLDASNALLTAPADLFVSVEVRSGEQASIARVGFAPTVIAAGTIGAYQGSSETTVSSSGGALGGGPRADAGEAPVGSAPSKHYLVLGPVVDEAAQGVADATVLFSFQPAGNAMECTTGVGGGVTSEFASPVVSPFLIVGMAPPAARPDLGSYAFDAVRLERQGGHAALRAPLVLARSLPFLGTVRDDVGVPLSGVKVTPCIVDDVFGMVLPLVNEICVTDDAGAFRIDGLPGRLPAQQSLHLVLSRAGLAPTAVAIPPRAGASAEVPFPPLTMRPLRLIHVHGLTPHQPVHIIEELPGLPRGTGIRRTLRQVHAAGTAGLVHVGNGDLWVSEVGADTVRGLERDAWIGIDQYRPAAGPAAPWSLRFRHLAALAETDIELGLAFRHSVPVPAASSTAPDRTVSVLDISGNPVEAAQVFVTAGLTPAAMAAPRFLGFTEANGLLRWNDIGGTHVVVIAPDGRVASEAMGQGVGGNMTVEIPACGRVVLGAARRPGPNEPQIVPLRFEPVDADPELRGPAQVRFATANDGSGSGWTVRDLLPGEYRVVVGGAAIPITVPAGGFVTLQ